jgi:elongation factor Ts
VFEFAFSVSVEKDKTSFRVKNIIVNFASIFANPLKVRKMAITAKQVNDLRQQTGAGMMDCKNALVEADGDFEKAIEILRKKGQKVSEKRVDRDAKEGAVFAQANSANSEGVMIELNCETDFVARNDDFQGLGNSILEVAASQKPADLDGLLALPLSDGRAIQDHLTDAMGRIGEKIAVRNYAIMSGDYVGTYIHPGARVGVLIAFDGGDASEISRDVAMQIAAMSPVSIDESNVPQEVIEKELEIGREIARAEGKPEAIIEKIAQGKLSKFFKENTLLNQEFVKDPSKTVAVVIKEQNPNLKVKAFSRMQLGA